MAFADARAQLAHLAHLRPPLHVPDAVRLAQACAWAGLLLSLLLMQLRVSGVAPLWAVAVGFALFHAGAAAAAWGLARGTRQGDGAWAALACNAVPAALFWLFALSLAAFVAQVT
jgi:hypothetical protein